MSELDFDAVLDQVSNEFTEAEIINRWMPPTGDYTVVLSSLATGTSAKGGKTFAWWRLAGKILAEGQPEFDGKDFTCGFYSTKALFALKGDVSVLAGRKVDDIKIATKILSEAADKHSVVEVNVRETKNADSGQTFTNTSITKLLDEGENK